MRFWLEDSGFLRRVGYTCLEFILKNFESSLALLTMVAIVLFRMVTFWTCVYKHNRKAIAAL